MKKFFTLLVVLSGAWLSVAAQDDEIDHSFEFVTASGDIIPNGSVITMNNVEVEVDPGTGEETFIVPADFLIKNVANQDGNYVRIFMNITQIDNGEFSTCALGNCIPPVSSIGELYTASQNISFGKTCEDLQTEWYAYDYGKCIVEMQLEVGEREGFSGFSFIDYGPMITVEFVNPDPAGIGAQEMSVAVPVARYAVDGRIVSAQDRGLQVVRYSDGTVRKVVVR